MIQITKDLNLPDLVKEPITCEQLRKYANASTDHNPIHLDDSAAKSAGLPGVIAHGMLTMAFMGEYLYQSLEFLSQTSGLPLGRIQEMSCRFKAMTFPGDTITIRGHIRKIEENTSILECDLEALNQNQVTTATGHAVLSLKTN